MNLNFLLANSQFNPYRDAMAIQGLQFPLGRGRHQTSFRRATSGHDHDVADHDAARAVYSSYLSEYLEEPRVVYSSCHPTYVEEQRFDPPTYNIYREPTNLFHLPQNVSYGIDNFDLFRRFSQIDYERDTVATKAADLEVEMINSSAEEKGNCWGSCNIQPEYNGRPAIEYEEVYSRRNRPNIARLSNVENLNFPQSSNVENLNFPQSSNVENLNFPQLSNVENSNTTPASAKKSSNMMLVSNEASHGSKNTDCDRLILIRGSNIPDEMKKDPNFLIDSNGVCETEFIGLPYNDIRKDNELKVRIKLFEKEESKKRPDEATLNQIVYASSRDVRNVINDDKMKETAELCLRDDSFQNTFEDYGPNYISILSQNLESLVMDDLANETTAEEESRKRKESKEQKCAETFEESNKLLGDEANNESESNSESSISPPDATWETVDINDFDLHVAEVSAKKDQKDEDRKSKWTWVDILENKGLPKHILELYAVPRGKTTNEIDDALSLALGSKFALHKVDDSHYLIVFPSDSEVFKGMLAANRPGAPRWLRLRELCDASDISKEKVRKNANRFRPYVMRPQTCVAPARRAIEAALGIKSNVSEERRKAEKESLKAAREAKQRMKW